MKASFSWIICRSMLVWLLYATEISRLWIRFWDTFWDPFGFIDSEWALSKSTTALMLSSYEANIANKIIL